jgi:MYXO-CTERM domain-containing protein
MFEAKSALASIIGQSPDVQFGLMRYGQLEPGDAGFGSTRVGSQYLDADLNEVQTNYDGGSNGCGPADLLVAPAAGNAQSLLSWMDHQEDYPQNKELRANGYTPLTQSLASARQEIARVAADDPEAACRSYYVLLLTDGRHQCPNEDAGDPADRPRIQAELVAEGEALRDLQVGGTPVNVRTFVVGFGPGTEFASELDVLARVGGTAVDANGNIDLINGTAYQAEDPMALVESLRDAVGNARPRELCDGRDNDCDGAVDEDFPSLGQACREGRGDCENDGIVVCDADGEGTTCSVNPGDPRAEVCDDEDNDCDGQIDEGLINACGGCGDAPVEQCNGRDDDCDGATDEGVQNACGACGAVPRDVCDGADNDCDGRTDEGVLNACGACGQPPAEVCDCEDNDCDNRIDEVPGAGCPRCDCDLTNGGVEACDGTDNDCDGIIDEGVLNRCGECGAEPAEICNGLDDDCDGAMDENPQGVGEQCGSSVGACMPGVTVCVDSAIICNGGTDPMQEACDGADNDCDGAVDEDALNACGWCGPPRVEVCDNIDNDCDGADDNANAVLCRDDASCTNGECAPPCVAGECTNMRVCVDGFCVTPCRNNECPDGLVCQDGACGDPCTGIECPSGSYCTLGECVADDCNGPAGCPAGQMCVNGACSNDPCATAGCGAGQGCVDGVCFDSCDNVPCPDGQRCSNGVCEDDPCARVSCTFPLVCENGSCVMDGCFERECPAGQMCEAGACVPNPCSRVTCPAGETCHRGECTSGNEPPAAPSGDDGLGGMGPDAGLDDSGTGSVAGDSGCGCHFGGGGSPAGLALLVLLAGLRRRRQR